MFDFRKDKTIKVAHIISKADLTGGPGHSLLTIVKHLRKDRYQNFLLSNESGDLINKLKPHVSKIILIKPAVINKYNPFPFFLCIAKAFIFFIINRISIAHFQFHLYRDPFLIAAKLANVKSIIHIRGPSGDFRSSWLNLADSYIFNSYFTKSIAHLDTNLSQKAYVVHNAVDLDELSQIQTKTKNQICNDFGISSKYPIIGNINRIHPCKRIEYFIEMAKILSQRSNYTFLIAGAFQDIEYYKKLLNLIQKYGLVNNIYFLGQQHEITDVLSIIDLLVHTAFEEPFGRVIIESGVYKIPVVAFNSGGIPEIIENGKSGSLVKYGDVDGLVSSSENILLNKELANKYKENLYKRVLADFNVPKQIHLIESIYENILK